MAEENNPTNDPIILVDGSSYLYRAYHALPPLLTSANQPTGAIKGVISMVKRILIDHPNSPVAVVFDAKGKNFRHDMYEAYKANRPPMPTDLVEQIEPIHKIIKLMGIKLISVSGVEADDVIGTLANEAMIKELDTVISTGDKDMTQLVCKNVKVVNTMSGELLDSKGVNKKFGVPPERIVDYLALIGDTSDNVPGVDKVGPKTAVKWLKEYKDLEGIVKNSEKIGGKVGENLRSGLDQLSLSKELVTIKRDVELEVNIEELKVQPADHEALEKIYTELEFRSWLGKKTSVPEVPKEKIENNYELVLVEKDLDKWVKLGLESKTIAVDTETTGLDYMDADIVGISLATKPGKAAYIPFGHTTEVNPKQLSKELVLKKLKPLLESSNKNIIGQNIKFDRNIFSQNGITLGKIKQDTMLMSYILDASATRHNLDALAKFYLNYRTTTFEEVAGKGAKQVSFDQVPLEQAKDYASEDADITLRLFEKLEPLLNKEPSLKKLS